MCPACIASAAWAVAGVTSTGGLTVLVAAKLRTKSGARKMSTQPKSKEKSS
jgi:hypothetical protein